MERASRVEGLKAQKNQRPLKGAGKERCLRTQAYNAWARQPKPSEEGFGASRLASGGRTLRVSYMPRMSKLQGKAEPFRTSKRRSRLAFMNNAGWPFTKHEPSPETSLLKSKRNAVLL